MRFFLKIMILFFLSNCSFNNSSSVWLEKSMKKISLKDKLNKILLKSNDIMTMTFEEYKVFVDDYNKKDGYPDFKE